MRGDSFLKTLLPGHVPKDFINSNEHRFAAADVSNPKEFSKRVGMTVDLVSILSFVAILLYPQNAYLLLLLPIAVLPGIVLKKSVISAILSVKISSRKEKVNAYLHQALVAMLGYAKAGLTLPEIVREIAVMGLDELSDIFAGIHYAAVYGGRTLKAAMLDAAAKSPSKELAELLRGIISVMEAGGDLARFFEDRLEAYEVERKMWFTSYISKLQLVSEAYLTLVVVGPIFMIVIESSRLIMGKGSIQMLRTIVYVLIPLDVAMLILLLHASSPEKFAKRKGVNFTLLPLIGGLLGVAAGFVMGNPELFGIAGAIVSSLIAAVILHRLTSEEDRISKALPVFLNKVVALMEAEKDFTTAFRVAARDEPNPLGKYVKTFAEMINLGVPRHKAFLWLQNATAVPDLRMIAHVLGNIVNVSGKVRETMLALLGEMNRVVAFRKERVSATRMHILVMIMAFLVYLGISAAISTMLFTQISKLSVSGSVGIFSPNTAVLEQIKTIMRHAGYIIAAATAAGVGAAKGDMRGSIPYLAGLLAIAFAVGTMFLQR